MTKSQKKIPYERSFKSVPFSRNWSAKNTTSPREVFKNSTKQYKFICDVCNHEFERKLVYITNSSGCPYCSNTILCENKNCKICEEKSFQSVPRSRNWSSQNLKKP